MQYYSFLQVFFSIVSCMDTENFSGQVVVVGDPQGIFMFAEGGPRPIFDNFTI